MPAFYNQASLSYNNQTVLSNRVQGELVEVLSAAKTAISPAYRVGDTVAYAISLINAGVSAYSPLTLTDDLGAYPLSGGMATPLEYVEGSLRLFVDGVLQPAPVITDTQPLTVTGISLPQSSSAVLLYEATVTPFAPPGGDLGIINNAVITGAQLSTPIRVTEQLLPATGASLSILKAVSPTVVVENEPLTYTLSILNNGNEAIVATDDVVVNDTFDPVLQLQSVSLNGVMLTEGVQYTYNSMTGAFATLPGAITVPAATIERDPVTGAWTVVPGVTELTITGVL